ncbi:MAG: O-antigen ligase family protein [Candidatus Electryoneaceae bacterium]|nr:O-antigen ligase family protein [Candidatus Electryoneaceae bacterium]
MIFQLTPASIGGLGVGIFGPLVVARILFTIPRSHNFMLGLMVFSTCHIMKPFYQEVFFVLYRGVDRGFGVTIPDVIFLGFAIYLLWGGKRKRNNIWWPYNITLWAILIFISIMSLAECDVAYYGLFTVHKLVRGLILYWVIVNVVRTKRQMYVIILAFFAAMIFEGGFVLFSKYITKAVVNRAVGSFPHPNTLAMYMNLISPIALSMLMVGALPRKTNKWAILAIGMAMISVVFTKSRGALVFMMAALGFVMFTSYIIRPSWRKSKLVMFALIATLIFGSIAAPKIIQRFKKAPKESAETREYFNIAAKHMANDHFFGVGINTFSYMLSAKEAYYWDVYPDKWVEFVERGDYMAAEDFRWSKRGQSRLGTAHHVYLLFAAEIGWLGMWVFVVFVARFYLRNIIFFFRTKDLYYKSIALGMLAGLATLHVQGTLEWILRQTQMFYLFLIVCGLFTAIYNAQRREKRRAILFRRAEAIRLAKEKNAEYEG